MNANEVIAGGPTSLARRKPGGKTPSAPE